MADARDEEVVGVNGEQDAPQKKFQDGEIVIVSLVVGGADLFSLIATLSLAIPILGEVLVALASLTSGIVTWALQFFLSQKGVKNLWLLVGGIFDMIPVLNVLPTLTLGWIIVLIMENNSMARKVAEKVDKSGVGKIAGKV